MFGFLSPIALFGLLLLSIPILLHIFKPKKVRQLPFSSLRWLRASQHRMSRRIRLHQVLLFLLRAALLALLVLAMAKPILSMDGGGGSDRFVILDTSLSMTYRDDDGRSPLETGKKIAAQLVSRPGGQDRTTVLVAGAQARALGPLVGDAGPQLRRLHTAYPAATRTDLSDALRLIEPMSSDRHDEAGVELLFITDNHVLNWSQGAITNLLDQIDAPVRATVIDVGPPQPINGWIAGARVVESPAGDRQFIRVDLGAVGPQIQQRTVKLDNLPDLADQTMQVQLAPDSVAQIDFELPAQYNMRQKVARLSLDPPDALADDDVYWLNLDASSATRILIIEPASTQIEELQPGHHLRTALKVLPIAAPGTLLVDRRTEDEILAPVIRRADLVIMIDVPATPDSNIEALERHVHDGGGLVVFLGPSIDPVFYNTKMHNPLRPARSLLATPVGDLVRVGSGQTGTVGIGHIRWRHPIFAQLFDPAYGNISQSRFEAYYRLGAGDTNVLAMIGRDAPAVAERTLGAGKVLLFNTTANDGWSDLPRRKSFVYLIDRLIDYLAGGARRGMFTLGRPITVALHDPADDPEVTVTTPGGDSIRPTVRNMAGSAMIQLDNLRETGVYRIEYMGPAGPVRFPIVVQNSERDSTFVRADDQTLEAWWQPANFRIVRPDAKAGTIDLDASRFAFEHWLIAAACLALLAEMFFVHRLCPRMNPIVVTESIVAASGFFNSERGRVAAASPQEPTSAGKQGQAPQR